MTISTAALIVLIISHWGAAVGGHMISTAHYRAVVSWPLAQAGRIVVGTALGLATWAWLRWALTP